MYTSTHKTCIDYMYIIYITNSYDRTSFATAGTEVSNKRHGGRSSKWGIPLPMPIFMGNKYGKRMKKDDKARDFGHNMFVHFQTTF